MESRNPVTGEPWARIPVASPEDVNQAVVTAASAFKTGRWPDLSAAKRGRLLYHLADLVEKHADALAKTETTDNGKLLRETRAPISCSRTATWTPQRWV
jgi:(Z)-2-((N-methylformamido)methylene)-5-hydroxybutyrolactone dehydrogenase